MNVILTELVAMERCYREHGFHLRISIYPQHSHEVVQTNALVTIRSHQSPRPMVTI
jgi:hypothetical protein